MKTFDFRVGDIVERANRTLAVIVEKADDNLWRYKCLGTDGQQLNGGTYTQFGLWQHASTSGMNGCNVVKIVERKEFVEGHSYLSENGKKVELLRVRKNNDTMIGWVEEGELLLTFDKSGKYLPTDNTNVNGNYSLVGPWREAIQNKTYYAEASTLVSSIFKISLHKGDFVNPVKFELNEVR